MKIKEFFKRWKTGLKNLTPKQLIHSQLVGYGGAAIGLSIALTGLIFRTVTNFNLVQLGFSIFVAFLVWMQIISYISTRTQDCGFALEQNSQGTSSSLWLLSMGSVIIKLRQTFSTLTLKETRVFLGHMQNLPTSHLKKTLLCSIRTSSKN